VETALYRIVQESLTNIARHAQAQTASVLLERRPDRVRVIIEDDGVGFDPAAAKNGERLGLYGMRERAELLNGQLTIESTLDKARRSTSKCRYEVGDSQISRPPRIAIAIDIRLRLSRCKKAL
jgi:signal transduction histidine kinase